jgi:hypothetical protein
MADSKVFRLVDGRPISDLTLDATLIPSSGQKEALAGEGTPSSTNKYTTKSYVESFVQGVDWQESVQHSIDYVKSTAGAPNGTAASGEKCLNTNEAKLYSYTTSWDSGVAVSAGQRFIFKDDGSDTSGDSGAYTADDKIRQYNGTTFNEFTPTKGSATWIEDEDALYVFNASDWVIFGSTTQHNNLSNLQGGTTNEFYHLTAAQHAGLMVLNNRSTVPVPFKFCYKGGLPASQSDVEFYEAAGSFQRILMPSDGSIVKATLQSTSNRTAGTLTVEPTKNGTKFTGNDLDLVLDETTVNDAKSEVLPSTTGLTFAAGEKLGVKVTTDSSWAPNNSDLEITFFVVFNNPVV